MTIKKPVRSHKSPIADVAEQFINGAPDAVLGKAQELNGWRAKKQIITLGINPGLLVSVDAAARALHISRAAWLNQAIAIAISSQGEKK